MNIHCLLFARWANVLDTEMEQHFINVSQNSVRLSWKNVSNNCAMILLSKSWKGCCWMTHILHFLCEKLLNTLAAQLNTYITVFLPCVAQLSNGTINCLIVTPYAVS